MLTAMKAIPIIILGITMFLVAESSSANSVRIETRDAVYQSLTEEQAQAAARIVRLNGYSCNSISKFMPLIMSRGYHIICNGWRYSYEIRDVGGRFVVKPD